MYGHTDIVYKLLENKANVNAQNNKYKLTALTLGILPISIRTFKFDNIIYIFPNQHH
jgi:hypothetical protein